MLISWCILLNVFGRRKFWTSRFAFFGYPGFFSHTVVEAFCNNADVCDISQCETKWFDELFGIDNLCTWEATTLSSSSDMSSVRTRLVGIFSFAVFRFLLAKTALLLLLFNFLWLFHLFPVFCVDGDVVGCEYSVWVWWLAVCTFWFECIPPILQGQPGNRAFSRDAVERWHGKFYDARNALDRDTALCVWVCRWTHWGGLGVVLQSDEIWYVDLPLVRCEEEYGHAASLTAIINQCYSVSIDDLLSAGLYCICCVQTYDQIYFLDKLRNWA